jgi:hypothetical protein
MQTNQEFFATLTVVQLRAHLADFNATGISKARKAELVSMLTYLMDGAHIDATHENRNRITRRIAAGYKSQADKPVSGKSYSERMVNRLFGYHNQNGYGHMLVIGNYAGFDSPAMMAKLTPKQRKRYTKKYNRKYGNLLAAVQSM